MDPQNNFSVSLNQQSVPLSAPASKLAPQKSPLDKPQGSSLRFLRLALLVFGALVIIGGVYAFLSLYNQPSIPQGIPQLPIGQATNDQNPTVILTTLDILTDWKTYRNDQYGFEFRYPKDAVFSDKTNSYGTRTMAWIVPFENKYDKFTTKSFSAVIFNNRCVSTRTLPNAKVIINGVEYYYDNPEWTATSGMSYINRFKQYIIERNSKCIYFEERIAGTGTNETSPGASYPKDFTSFFDSEMKTLDEMMQTVNLF